MIERLDNGSGKVIGFVVSDKLHDEDYKVFVPEIEEVIEREGTARLLLQMRDFHGWDLHAAWDDMKFGVKHHGDLERMALVGEKKWEKWMASFTKPFTKAEVRYFDASEVDQAWEWLRE